jgi:hypothetical protein
MPPIRTTEGGASGRRGKSHGGLVWWIEPNAAERTGRIGSDGHCSLAASRFGSAGFGRRGAGSEGPASPTAAECPGRSRRATEANRDPRPGSGAWSIGPRPADHQLWPNPALAEEAQLCRGAASRCSYCREAKTACSIVRPFERRRLSPARPPQYRLGSKAGPGSIADRASDRPTVAA